PWRRLTRGARRWWMRSRAAAILFLTGGVSRRSGGTDYAMASSRRRPRRSHPTSGTGVIESSVGLVGQELARHHDVDAIAATVRLALEVHLEVDGAHDPVAELFMDQRLERRAVDIDQFIEAVDQRVRRDRRRQRA